MRFYRVFCLLLIICGGLSLVSLAQKKPLMQRQPPAKLSREQAERNKIPVRNLYNDMFTRGRYELKDEVFAKRCPIHFGLARIHSRGRSQPRGCSRRWRAPSACTPPRPR